MKVKQKNKIISIILLIITILMTFNASYAASLSSANLYSKGECGHLLKYKGITVVTTMVVYNNSGIEYPAYCMDKSLPGVGERGSYTVNINELVSNSMVWRAITNGYPYKTPSELGCSNSNEAFTATKQAVYCILYGNNVNDYSAIGEAGTRTLNALKSIAARAQNSSESKPSSNIQIEESANAWNIDSLNKNYLSKTYNVVSATLTGDYEVTINGTMPENSRITDLNNNAKSVFAKGEKFKIVIPISNMKEEGEFTINISAKANTKPVFFGKAPNATLQDYAITASTYEDAVGSLKQRYYKNTTKIVILKQDGLNKEPLKNGEFSLLDENKNVVYSNLVTDERGEIILKNMIPGKFYLQENKAPGDYVLYDKLIPITLNLNESVSVTVNNFKKDVVDIINLEENIVVSQKSSEINIGKSQANTVIENKKQSVNIENISTSAIASNLSTTVNVENTSSISNISENNTVVKLPKTGM